MKSFDASPVQSQFYLASQLHPTPALNTMTYAVRVRGPLAYERLSRSIVQLSSRHIALRTRLSAVDGSVVQLVDDEGPQVPLDLENAPVTDEAFASAVEFTRQSLSPESATWKALLLEHAADDHTLVFAAHRSCWDESSIDLFASELSALYAAEGNLDAAGLPPVYSDEELVGLGASPSSERIAAGARHFADALADLPPVHGFPTQWARSKTVAVEAASVETVFDNAVLELLSAAARQWEVEPFVVLATAASYVLAQYSGQQKLAIGLPFELRPLRGERAALGSHTAMLPLGIDCSASTFEALVWTVAEQYRAAQEHASTPFHAIVKQCGGHVHPAANPLFQVGCVPDKQLPLLLSGCECSPRSVSVPPQQVDLFLQFTPSSVRVGYATHLIASDMAASFARSLVAFLETGLREPTRALSTLPLLSDGERDALLVGFNRTSEAAFLEPDLYSLITRHCVAQADKTALLCGGRSLSYAALLDAATTLSSRLIESGVGQGGLVGICTPRSVDMVVAMLAVLRCGAAYVPLDPAFPTERLNYMVAHSGLRTIVTTPPLRRLFEPATMTFIEIDHEESRSALAVPPPARVAATATAYVIYTSGSTGKPKGVAVPRGAAVNFLSSMLQRPGIEATDTSCAVTTLSFDIAVLELFAPLCAGASIVIATEEEARDPRLLMGLMEAHQVTFMQATPITWQMLCAAGWSGGKSLKALCGGEALASSLARTLVPRVRELWNMYGPTETTVWSTCKRIDDPEAEISVGTPIHNTSIYVVDEHLRPVPAGVEGRLFIGGWGVALGYLFDDELTAKRFVPDAFQSSGRMYDTGDRARFSAGGELHVVGRSDFQVKLRGFRIELGEVETCLSGLPGIEQVVCAVRRDDPAQPELVAYYTLKAGGAEPSVAELRAHCSAALPAHMIPSRFRRLDEFPRTPNGKIDRQSLPKPAGDEATSSSEAAPPPPRNVIERALLEIWCNVLSIKSASVNDGFFELGGTSLAAFSVVQEIARRLNIEISVLRIFEYPTIATLARFLKGNQDQTSVLRDVYQRARARRKTAESSTAWDVAIIGAAGRFPGARNLDELWKNLSEGRETITVFSREELDPIVPDHDRNDKAYVPARGVLEDVQLFDAAFFGISPNEAELMDPQQRVFMEVAWEAFENAGYVGEKIDGLVGVWAGMGNNFYYHHNVLTRPDKLALMGEIAAELANEKDHIAPRVSHKLNLTGPSLSVHTACSTTLVVVDSAYHALVTHQVDVALAGGVDIRTPQKSGQRYEDGGVFSDDGHCRPFDAGATGTMFGEGAGALVLKRLDDAIADNDTVYAVIKGTAVNHDGGNKVSYLAPSVDGQARVIAQALGTADVNPDTISFVEAHGTATPIGDPIEVEALTRVYRTFTQRRRFCAIGSVKGNFGHATTAAGIAGILKVVMSMRHRKIPGTLHYKTPNPRIDFTSSPFFVTSRLMDWEPKGFPRRASVSSFGFCGTNAHVILEEAPAASSSTAPTRPAQLMLLSARKPKALEDAALRLSTALNAASPSQLADAAFTTHVGRKRFEYRRCVVLQGAEEASTFLVQSAGARSASLKSEATHPALAFVFPGQGSQYINMGLRLYQGEDCYRDAVDRCATGLLPHLGCDLRDFLFPKPGDSERAEQALNNTFYTQPAIFTVSYAIATQFMHWGIQPSTFLGHSIGEFVAATLSEVMSVDDALRLVATRGRLMQGAPGGSMLTVRLSIDALVGRLPPGVDVAAVNGPELVVVAGPTQVVEAFRERLAAEGVNCRMLHTSHAFHSSMMEEVVEPFLRTVETVRLSAPQIPFVSTVTGDWIKTSEVTDPSYWARHLRSPVQYSKAVQVLMADETQVLLECGPRRTCSTLALQHRPKNPGRVIASMPDSSEPDDEYPNLLLALGSLWLNGSEVDWAAFHERETRHRIALPSYAFQRKRHWIEPGNVAAFGLDASVAAKPVASVSHAVEESSASGNDAAPNADPLMASVIGLLEEVMGCKLEDFDEDARFVALGLDSLLLTQLARMVRVRLGFEATFRDLTERYSTTKLLCDAIRTARAKMAAPAAPTVAAVQAQPASMLTHVSDARLGYDERGRPAWFAADFSRPGKYLQIAGSNNPKDTSPGAAATHVDYDPFLAPSAKEIESTSAQIEMWLSAQAGAGASCAYNQSFSIRLKGPVVDDALVRALQALPHLHEALRAHFSANGELFIIEPTLNVAVARHDLSRLAPAKRAEESARLGSAGSEQAYDLENGPLFRAAVIALAQDERQVLLEAHHASCDGWSLDVLLADLGRLYSAFAGEAALPPLPVHGFSDYASHTRTAGYQDLIAKSRAFWRKTFETLPAPLALPHDGRRPELRSFGAHHALHHAPFDVHAAVRDYARAQGISFFSVLFSAFTTLLHRVSGATDLVIGVPIAGHPDVGMEDCVGHLVSLVPVRCHVESEWSFVELCRRNNTAILDARENASLGFGELVAELNVPRDPSRIPLVDVTFTHVQQYAPGKLNFGKCSVEYHLNPRSFETFELNLNVIEAHDHLEFVCHANSELYSEPWVNWRLVELERILREGCSRAETRVGKLALLPEAEKRLICDELNQTAAVYPHELSLAQLFESQVDKTPDVLAVELGVQTVSYRELDARANRLAHVLASRGIRRGALVGICLNRSVDMIVAVLAVLKAGGGYVPLDPAFPAERLAFMVEDSALLLVVSESGLSIHHGCGPSQTLELRNSADELRQASSLRLADAEQKAQPGDTAYVLYTSGSTGKPKGVRVHHRAAVNFLTSMQREPGLSASDRLLAVTTLSFDIALLELMLPLVVGARVVVATRDEAIDGEALRALIERHGITVMQATPATWRLLLESGWKGSPSFRALCGGEALSVELAEALLGRVGQLWNMYGPTETTVWSTCTRVTQPRAGIFIGRPIANTTIWILDPQLELCPVGVPGEIYIGGDGVALEYLNRPDLTAERFFADPFSSTPGARLYKTGDLGRWRNDGQLEHLGRNDFQIKIRGYRIELGEIESALLSFPSVSQAVVNVARASTDDAQLVGYLVMQDRRAEVPAGLVDHLKSLLPSYMVPASFMVLSALPLTPNGKIDRNALPKTTGVVAPVEYHAPQSHTEQLLAELWQRMLTRERISVTASFFDIGGHSLLALRLVTEIGKAFSIKLPMAHFLQNTSIRALAAVIDEMPGRQTPADLDSAPGLTKLRAGGPKSLFFVYDGFGELLPYVNLARRMPSEYGVYGISPLQLPEIPLAHLTIQEMATYCVEVIQRRQAHGPYHLAGLCAGGVIAFEVARQLEAQNERVEVVILLDAVAPSAALRPWLVTLKRFKRFGRLFAEAVAHRHEHELADASGAWALRPVMQQAVSKIRNVVVYEAAHSVEQTSVAARLAVLRRVLAHDRVWPKMLPPLRVPEIYEEARVSYRPGVVAAHVVLVRANEGADGDAPARELVVDPLLGWGGHTTGTLDVIDATGGHSSMLQEPRVEELASQLVQLLNQA